MVLIISTFIANAGDGEPGSSLCVDKVESLAATDRYTARKAAEALFAAGDDAIPCLLANANDHRPYHGECWKVDNVPGYPKNSSDFEQE